MTRSVRNALLATLIGLHAAVTFCGPGLHALPGWSHGTGLTPFARNDHSHGPGPSSHQASDDCPVCQFLAQGQVVPDLGVDVAILLPRDLATPVAMTFAPGPRPRLFIPRGPPSKFFPVV